MKALVLTNHKNEIGIYIDKDTVIILTVSEAAVLASHLYTAIENIRFLKEKRGEA